MDAVVLVMVGVVDAALSDNGGEGQFFKLC